MQNRRRPGRAVATRNVILHNFGISQLQGVTPPARFRPKNPPIDGRATSNKSRMLCLTGMMPAPVLSPRRPPATLRRSSVPGGHGMTTASLLVAGSALIALLGPSSARAQLPVPPPPMTFFVTSVPIGNGGDLGGVAGADAHCGRLATAAGAGSRTWHAYLSTQPRDGQPAINARDRIGP